MLTKIEKNLLRDERGLSTMEYAVLFVMIVVGTVALWNALGENLVTNLKTGVTTVNGTMDTGSTRAGTLPE